MCATLEWLPRTIRFHFIVATKYESPGELYLDDGTASAKYNRRRDYGTNLALFACNANFVNLSQC